MDIKISQRGRYILNNPELADKVMKAITGSKSKLMHGESVPVTDGLSIKLAKVTGCPPTHLKKKL